MRARQAPARAMRALGRGFGEGVMWMGFGWFGALPPRPWSGYALPLVEQPCLPPLSQEEFVRWTAPVKDL